MFIPVGQHIQHILQVKKDADGNVTKTELMGVRVSLLHMHKPVC
jgi:protein-L-isoaspartate O-methyltransferase